MRGELCHEVGVEADFVVEVGEVGFPGVHFFDEGEGLCHVEVGEMLAVTECIYYQHFQPLQLVEFLFGDGLGVGDVGEVTYAVAHDG